MPQDFSREAERFSPHDKVANDIKRHVVQIEGMVLYVIVFQLTILMQPILSTYFEDFALLVPFAVLAFLPMIVRVTNPEDTVRAILKSALSGFGVGAAIGGGIAGTLTGGLGAPAGSLIGGPCGAVIGAAMGPWLDGKKDKSIYTQGEARAWLVDKRKKYPDLLLEEILAATEHPSMLGEFGIRTFLLDGIPSCTKEELHEYIERRRWRMRHYA